jgi:hypothetical protein
MPTDDHRREQLVISRGRRVVDDQHGGDERRAQRAARNQMANANVDLLQTPSLFVSVPRAASIQIVS